MLEDLKPGDTCIFQDGDEAMVLQTIDFKKDMAGRIRFNKEVEGHDSASYNWNYHVSGEWIGGGNNIVKVIHEHT